MLRGAPGRCGGKNCRRGIFEWYCPSRGARRVISLTRGELTSEFTADLYAAAIEGDRLDPLCAVISKQIDASSAGIWLADKGAITDIVTCGRLRDSQIPYAAYFYKLDLWNQNLQRVPPGRAILSCEHTPENTLKKTEFYNDFIRQLGIVRPMMARLQVGAQQMVTVSFAEPDSKRLFEEDDKPRLQKLLPYVKGALQLRYRQRHAGPRADSRSAALDALAFGAVVCDAAGRVILANSSAEMLARNGGGLQLGNRRKEIGALMPAEKRDLLRLIDDAARGGPGGSLRLSNESGFPALLVLVTPLPRQSNGHDGLGHALVSLRSVRDGPSFSVASLVSLFRLSPAQAEIALSLYNGKSPDEIATERGVRISTLRSHLAEVFARTGTQNQRDLIRLLGMFPPLRRP